MEYLTFKDKEQIYAKNFSLGYINSDISSKFALISLVCYLVEELRKKKPGITHYSLLYKINENIGLPQDFIESVSIICSDFAYGCHEFPTFGVEKKNIIPTIQEILNKYIPF